MDNAYQAPIAFWIKRELFAGGDEGGDGGDGGAGGDGGDGGAGGDGGQGGQGGGDQGFQIPEKFLVKAETGEVDHLKTMEKMHGSYAEMEKRMGTVGLPPKTAAEYKLDKFMPDDVETKDEALTPILARFHAKGMTNAQVQEVFNVFGETFVQGREANKADWEAGQAALKESWGESYDKNLQYVGLAKRAYADDTLMAELEKANLDNHPTVLKILAKVGRDLTDDSLPSEMSSAEQESIDALRNSEAYRDPKHPEHATVKAKVNAAYEKGYKAKGGGMFS